MILKVAQCYGHCVFLCNFLRMKVIITILDEYAITHWCSQNKDWYINKGYTFTKYKDELRVKVKDLPPTAITKIRVKCDYCGQEKEITYVSYSSLTNNLTTNYACSDCRWIKRKEQNIEGKKCFQKFIDFCNKNNYTPLSVLDDYKNHNSILKFICPIHGEEKIRYKHIKLNSICYHCAHMSRGTNISIDNIISIVESKNNDIILNPEEYINYKERNLKIVCGKCGNIFKTSYSSIKASSGYCPDCGMRISGESNKLIAEQVTQRIESIHRNILLNPEDYQNTTTVNLKIKCGICKERIFITSLSNYDKGKNRCNYCSNYISKGEQIIKDFLDYRKIKYIFQKRFEGCKNKKKLPFDFYLPDYNMCIEFDGPHHYYAVYTEKQYLKTVEHDQIKNKYCEENNIKLIRIPYWEGKNIENILMKELHLHKHIKYIHPKSVNK